MSGWWTTNRGLPWWNRSSSTDMDQRMPSWERVELRVARLRGSFQFELWISIALVQSSPSIRPMIANPLFVFVVV